MATDTKIPVGWDHVVELVTQHPPLERVWSPGCSRILLV